MADPTTVSVSIPHWIIVAYPWVGGIIVGFVIGCFYTDWKRSTFA